jgi:hypothetical protein
MSDLTVMARESEIEEDGRFMRAFMKSEETVK